MIMPMATKIPMHQVVPAGFVIGSCGPTTIGGRNGSPTAGGNAAYDRVDNAHVLIVFRL